MSRQDFDSRSSLYGYPWVFGGLGLVALLIMTAGPTGGGPSTAAYRSTLQTAGAPLYIPAAAHVSGAVDTDWRTDVEVFNLGDLQARFEIALLKKNQDNQSPETVDFSLNPGTAVRYEDVLESVFGFTGSAALRITAEDGEIMATSRTYNRTSSGTYGQFIGARYETGAIAEGQAARLIQLTHNTTTDDGFRTNVGFLNCTASTIRIEVELYRSDGTLLGSKSYQLGPYTFTQKDRIFATVTQQEVDDGYVVVRSPTPGALFFAYASVVDNRTGDPVYVPAEVLDSAHAVATDPGGRHSDRSEWRKYALASEPVYVAATAHVAGAAGTDWRTDLELHNPGSSEGRYEIALLETNRNNSSPRTAVFTVGPGESLRLEDILASAFAYGGTAALRITPLSGAVLILTSRTYNLTDEGTYGQFLGGVTESQAIGDDEQGIMIQLSHHRGSSAGYRTNIGFLNCGASPITVHVELYSSDGTLLGALDYELGPSTHKQANKIFQEVAAADIDDGYAVVTTTTAGARFLAYASVVDNATGDPVYIPAVTVSGAPPPTPTPTPTVGPGEPMDPLPTMQDVFSWLTEVPGGGDVPELEEAVSRFQSEGLDALLDEVVDANPGFSTRTANGIELDFGNGWVFDDGSTASGRATISFTNIVNTSSRVAMDASFANVDLQVNGGLPPVDSATGSMDLAVDGSGHVAGTATASGSGRKDSNSFNGNIEVDTLICRYYPIGGTVTFTIDGQTHTFSYTPECDGDFGYQPPGGPGGIDFDDLSGGTTVTNQYPEAVFSSTDDYEIRIVPYSVASQPNSICSIGQTVPPGDYYCTAEDLFISFTAPVNELSITAFDVRTQGWYGTIRVYENGVLTANRDLYGNGDDNYPHVIDLGEYDSVTRIDFINETEDDSILWDDVLFNVVEPR
jgi:hypothetical protein